MKMSRLLGLLIATLGVLTWGGDANAIRCGITFPCPSDIYQITDSNGNIVNDINGNPASRTISEVGETNQQIQVYIGSATITGIVYLTEGPVPLSGFAQASDEIVASTGPDASGSGNDVQFNFQSDDGTVPLAYVDCKSVACVAETGQLQDLTSYFSMSGASLRVLASSDAGDAIPPGIFWVQNYSEVAAARLDGSFVNPAFVRGATNNPSLYGVAFDGSNLYWTDQSTNTIWWATLDQQAWEQYIVTSGQGVIGLAIDDSYFYWVNGGNNGNNTLGRANRNFLGFNPSLITGAMGPRSVASDGTYIYWTNLFSNTIGRANRDGTGINQSFITGADIPAGVAVDGTHIYWGNSHVGAIGRANLDGTSVNQSFITGGDGVFGLAVDGSYIYWTNYSPRNTIGRANIDGTGVNQAFITQAYAPLGLAVLNKGAAPLPIEWVHVASPGNSADSPSNCLGSPSDCGSVAYAYDISEYKVTNAQYAEFLNAKAASDPLGLYTFSMSDPNDGGIYQGGVSGGFTYTVKPFFQNKPVTFVSFYSALRFANWLNNGKGDGDTESGSYTLLGGTPVPSNAATITRNAGGNVFVPSENEWYKAAYYDLSSGSYFAYPYGTNTLTTCAQSSATANTANCNNTVDQVTDVGSYTGASGPFGTYDQVGDLQEWTDKILPGGNTVVRGASWGDPPSSLAAGWSESIPSSPGVSLIGFRVVRALPSCGLGSELTIILPSLLWLRGWRRRKRE
jgi:formylglycine-generating enzyme required for sulfatase activity